MRVFMAESEGGTMNRCMVIAAVAVTTVGTAAAGTANVDPVGGSARCRAVPVQTLESIRFGVRASVRPKLRSARAVKARREDFSKAPRGFSHDGVYFISANLRSKGVATWAVSTSFYRTGGGPIYAVGRLARRVSVFGSGLRPGVLAGWGVSPSTYGYTQSRACVK
jgi:hypothetical protein